MPKGPAKSLSQELFLLPPRSKWPGRVNETWPEGKQTARLLQTLSSTLAAEESLGLHQAHRYTPGQNGILLKQNYIMGFDP